MTEHNLHLANRSDDGFPQHQHRWVIRWTARKAGYEWLSFVEYAPDEERLATFRTKADATAYIRRRRRQPYMLDFAGTPVRVTVTIVPFAPSVT
jgi:hypothetical protein